MSNENESELSKVKPEEMLSDEQRKKAREELELQEIDDEVKLLPRNDNEKELWQEIEGADRPIKTTLKRMNRILEDKFPDSEVQTIDSCSGHVKQDGSITYKAVLPEFADRKRELYPSLFLSAPIDKISEQSKGEIKGFLDNLFSQVVSQTNDSLSKESVLFGTAEPQDDTLYSQDGTDKEVCIFAYSFPLSEERKAFKVLQTFWKNMRDSLRTLDGLRIDESFDFDVEDFLPNEPGPGLIRPE